MSRFFILSTDPLLGDQETQLREWADANFNWWHWLPNFWLLKDDSDTWTVGLISDHFGTISGNARCMVFQVDPVTWGGRVRPNQKGDKMERWIIDNWKRA